MNNETVQLSIFFCELLFSPELAVGGCHFQMYTEYKRFLIRLDCKISFRKRGKVTDQVLLHAGLVAVRSLQTPSTPCNPSVSGVSWVPESHGSTGMVAPLPEHHLRNGSSEDRSQLSIYNQSPTHPKMRIFGPPQRRAHPPLIRAILVNPSPQSYRDFEYRSKCPCIGPHESHRLLHPCQSAGKWPDKGLVRVQRSSPI
jgi:hypothetical protein